MRVRNIALAGALFLLAALAPEHALAGELPPAVRIHAMPTQITFGSGHGPAKRSGASHDDRLGGRAEIAGPASQATQAHIAGQPTPPVDGNSGVRLSPGPIIGLILAFMASTIALGVAFGVRSRIDKIAGPDPEQEED